VGLYLGFIMGLALLRPAWVPALPPEARIYNQPDGSSGHTSLLVLMGLSLAAALGWSVLHADLINPLMGREGAAPRDEVFILSFTVGAFFAFVLASVNRVFRVGLLSRLTERVTFVLIPPLVLIFLVLGTIFLGIATPTEGGAMGAVGALVMAAVRRTLSLPLLQQALESSTKLSIFVLFILIGSTVFSFTFNAADGHIWVEHLFDQLPGGQIGFLIFVNLLVFGLGFFIDFFEIAFIVIPLLAPVADKLGIDLIWFGVMIAMNLQTSFLTPPFGFALFYLRSVAAREDYTDQVTRKRIAAVTTAQIYKGSIAFIVLQVIMVALILMYPQLVTGNLQKTVTIDEAQVLEMLNPGALEAGPDGGWDNGALQPGAEPDAALEAPEAAEEDPNQALLDALKKP
jgi:TRAP-type mannitol/chloroaromatic compound transport system permease large subunit